MWQLNSNDNAATDKAVLLRPHFKTGGTWTAYPGLSGSNLVNKDVTAAVGYNTDEIEGKLLHERIEVDGKVIKTYFGATADSLTLAYEYTHTADVPLYNIGFRHATATGTDGVERPYYDNIVVKDADGHEKQASDPDRTQRRCEVAEQCRRQKKGQINGQASDSGDRLFVHAAAVRRHVNGTDPVGQHPHGRRKGVRQQESAHDCGNGIYD
jgi:hypothetical protein